MSGLTAEQAGALFPDAPKKHRTGYGRKWHIGKINRGWWLADGVPYNEDGSLTDARIGEDYSLIHAFDTKIEAEYWQLKFQQAADENRPDKEYSKQIATLLKRID